MTRARIAIFVVLVFYLAALPAYGQLDKVDDYRRNAGGQGPECHRQ